MSSIFDISARLMEAYELAVTGDVDSDTIAATIEGIEWELEQKADNYAGLIAEIKGGIDVIDKEINRLKAMKQTRENFIKALKDNLYKSMLVADNKKFKTPLHSYWIQLNPPALVVSEEDKIPKEYYIPQPDKLDAERLKKDILTGIAVDGARVKQDEGVRMR